MKFTIQAAALVAALGGLLAPVSSTQAAEVGHFISSNAVDKCQAFTPGITNTIRNRVIGAENVGASPIAVACVFQLSENYGMGSAITDDLSISFASTNPAPVTVNCTMLPGSKAFDGIGTAVNQSVDLAAGSGTGELEFTGPWSVFSIGINCTLPPNVTITGLVHRYRDGS
jgi:hypothetical protein